MLFTLLDVAPGPPRYPWHNTVLPWIVLPLLAAAFVYARPKSRERPAIGPGRAGRIGAAAALVICMIVGIQSWRAVQSPYRADAAGPQVIVPPSAAAPLGSPDQWPPSDDDLARLRYVVHILLTECVGKARVPHDATSFVVEWSRPQPSVHELSIEGNEVRVAHTLMPLRGKWPALADQYPGSEIRVIPSANSQWRTESEGVVLGTAHRPHSIGLGILPSPIFSAVSAPGRHVELIVIAQPLSDDGTRQTIPAAELLAAVNPGGWQDRSVRKPTDPRLPRGYSLAIHFGPASWLLAGASLLAALCFRQRNIAFAGLLLLAILYLVAIDRWALSVHRKVLRDPSTTPTQRMVAANMIESTFFYRAAAGNELGINFWAHQRPKPSN